MPLGHDFKWCRVPKWKIMYNSGLKTFLDTHPWKLSRLRKFSSARPGRTSLITSGQLVVYYQCCVLIGWVITRLYVIAHWWRKAPRFENQNNSSWIAFCYLKLFILDIFEQQLAFTKTFIPLALLASESIAHSGSRNNCQASLLKFEKR